MSAYNGVPYTGDAPAYYPNSVVVGGNGKPLSSSSSNSGSSLQQIINSGVPITSGNSGSSVDATAASLGSLSGLNFNFDLHQPLIRQTLRRKRPIRR